MVNMDLLKGVLSYEEAFEGFARSTMENLIPNQIEECKIVNAQLMSMEKYLKSEGWDSRQI